uniref:Fasciculation and elongation protein zeta 2a n=1 Tax=Tetraodon nigroviridis TaxID=99883 RepID=H3CW93_TETNG
GPRAPAGVAALPSAEDFERTLSVCFQKVHVQTDAVGPARWVAEDWLLEEDEVWVALTSSYGCVQPPDWKRSHAGRLGIPAVPPKEQPVSGKAAEEPSDEEELREQLDMHSIIVSCLTQEPLLTAEQVIEEIEEMMQDSADAEPRPSAMSACLRRARGPGFETESLHPAPNGSAPPAEVRSLSIARLNEHLEESETEVRRLSEELVQQLALRDELDFEKEVKNAFISTLIEVQNRQKEQRELKKKKKRSPRGTPRGGSEKSAAARFSMEALSSAIQSSFRQTFGSSCSQRQHLTTVIPYERTGQPPSLGDLQILTKILQAMRDNSDKVPALLTDYILQVLCPT